MEGKALDRIQNCMDLYLLFSFYCLIDAQPCNFLQTLIGSYRSILLGRSKILINRDNKWKGVVEKYRDHLKSKAFLPIQKVLTSLN